MCTLTSLNAISNLRGGVSRPWIDEKHDKALSLTVFKLVWEYVACAQPEFCHPNTSTSVYPSLPVMVNFHDPAEIAKSFRTPTFRLWQCSSKRLTSSSLNSGGQDLFPCLRWHLPVGLPCRAHLPFSSGSTPGSSWEFVTTLNYDFDIIRRKHPYKWTIWVRSDWPFLNSPT
jgi:hypothetical protein